MRQGALTTLLKSVKNQIIIPSEIIIIDGSRNEAIKDIFKLNFHSLNIRYYLVSDEDRGLACQRNYGINKLGEDIGIVSFLDDDIALEPEYFQELLKVHEKNKGTVGVGGYIVNEVSC